MQNRRVVCIGAALVFLIPGCAAYDGQTGTHVAPATRKPPSIHAGESVQNRVAGHPPSPETPPLAGEEGAKGLRHVVRPKPPADDRGVAEGEAGFLDGTPGLPGGLHSDANMENDYVIGPEDVVEVSVWKNNDLSKTVIVRPDGRISLPLIGDMRASGFTPSELKEAIATKLKKYKEDPTVSVIVQEINSYNIFVMGEVAHPGKFRLKSNTTILQALSLAGGFTPYASRNKILLMRKDPRTQAVTEIRVKYDKILSGQDPLRDILLQSGDTIVVP